MQSKIDSLMEALTNILFGFVIAAVSNYVILPWVLGIHVSAGDSMIIAVLFTLVSLVRQYSIRRAFNGRSIWEGLKCRFC